MNTTYLVLDKQGTRGRVFDGRGDKAPITSTPEPGKLTHPLTKAGRDAIYHDYVLQIAAQTGQTTGLVRVPRMVILEVIEGALSPAHVRPTLPAPGRP